VHFYFVSIEMYMLLKEIVMSALLGNEDAWNAWFNIDTLTDKEFQYVQLQCQHMIRDDDHSGFAFLLLGNLLEMRTDSPISNIIKYYDQAVKRNNVLAMIFRAQMYEHGHGEPGNIPHFAAAKALYERALNLGDWWSLATYGLGMLSMQGQGCPDEKPDYITAACFFAKGLKQKHLGCTLGYGELLENGYINPGQENRTTTKQKAYQQESPQLFFADTQKTVQSAQTPSQGVSVEENIFSDVLGAGYF